MYWPCLLTTGAVFVLSNPTNAVARESPVMVGKVAAHPDTVALAYNPAVLGWLRISAADC